MIYDLSAQPLLSKLSRTIRDTLPDDFEQHVALAAEVLGIADLTFTDTGLERIERALALQVNHQILIMDKHPELFFTVSVASSQTKQGLTYRDLPSLAFPPAAAIVTTVVGSSGSSARYESLKSLRRNFQ